MSCKTCGLNHTHGTNSHVKWAKDPSAFRMNANHPWHTVSKERGALVVQPPPMHSPNPLVAQGPPSTAETGQSSIMSASDTLMFSRAALYQQFATFEWKSTDLLRILVLENWVTTKTALIHKVCWQV